MNDSWQRFLLAAGSVVVLRRLRSGINRSAGARSWCQPGILHCVRLLCPDLGWHGLRLRLHALGVYTLVAAFVADIRLLSVIAALHDAMLLVCRNANNVWVALRKDIDMPVGYVVVPVGVAVVVRDMHGAMIAVWYCSGVR